jgi:formyltetrahydrofolate deformylase
MLYKKTFILTLSCPDNIGIVHAVTGFLATRQGNIIEAAQYTDVNENRFFMRIKFELLHSNSEHSELFDESLFKQALSDLANTLSMTWALHDATTKMPTILMVSKLGHCFNDLLFRYKSGLIPLDIKAVVSNHREYYQLAAQYNIPFYHFPVTQDTKPHAESQLLSLIKDNHIELVVLARYMQVLSDDLCKQLDGSTTTAINIHHSFLPSFKGARPYYQAHNRGVKIIGATAHFVTADLDEGPIIEQDVARVEHTQDPEQFTAIGRDVECIVLSRAVTWFAQHRVLRNGNKTVVFK